MSNVSANNGLLRSSTPRQRGNQALHVQHLRERKEDVRIRRIRITNNQAYPERPCREAPGSRNYEKDYQTRFTLVKGKSTRGNASEEV